MAGRISHDRDGLEHEGIELKSTDTRHSSHARIPCIPAQCPTSIESTDHS
jgi:hypothetical protein